MPALRHWILATIVALAALALTPVPATAQAAPSAGERSPDRPRPAKPRAPVNANAAQKKTPPGTDPRQVRPADAFPPERVQTPPPKRDPGAGTPDAGLQNDPRGVEERRDPEP